MQFIHQPLTWGFLLVLLPVLIHLINMMRHRRVQWAAMDFLIASYRKHRRWVWLKQLLLLLLRMIAIAAAVAMLAQLVSQNRWSLLFGKQTTHHFVLFDDSLSMTARTGGGTAFDQGRRAISAFAAEAAGSDHAQLMTLIRYSQASRSSDPTNGQTAAIDLNAAPITGPLENMIEQQGGQLHVSQLALDAQPAMDLVETLIRDTKNQRCVLHIVSDFRQSEWSGPTELQESLNRVAKLGTKINLIRCVESQFDNLVVESLTPEVGTQAAGVPLFMNVVVRNLSSTAAERIRLKTRSVVYPTSPMGTESALQETDLPDILIDRIEPGESVTRTFQVFFATAGHHVVSVELPGDVLMADNRRWCVVTLEEGESALIVDGDPEERSAYYLESIFRPGTKAKTGITPTVQPLSYLRDASVDELARHRAIYLLDLPPLDTRTLANLKTYVENGGGVACFLGPNANSAFFSDWYEQGVFPAPIELPQPNVIDADPSAPDVHFEDHPIFRALVGQRNPFASSIRIQKYMETQPRWTPPSDSGIQILARLQQRSPLVLERAVGAGRFVAFLTTLAPDWNNWSLEPSFIVVTLQLHAYLAQPRHSRDDRTVGDTLTVQIDSNLYQPELTFVIPTDDDESPRELSKVAEGSGRTDTTLLSAALGGQGAGGDSGETDFSGVYDIQLKTVDGRLQHQRYALNIDTKESHLESLNSLQLRQTLEPVRVAVYQADQRIGVAGDSTRGSWSEWLLGVLLAVLLAEQWLAYRLSYHPYAVQPAGGSA